MFTALTAHSHANAVDLHIFHGDYQAFAAVDDAGFDQFYFLRLNVDDNVRGFDLELAGVGDVEATMVAFSPAATSYWSSKVSSFFLFYAAVLKRRFTSDLVSTTGSGESFWASMISFSFS